MYGQILILDDNPMDLKVASALLERSGYACSTFTKYKEAFDSAIITPPTIIFLDIEMPEISGYELIPLFRQLPQTKEVPIFIISGKNQLDDVKKAISLGANDYIVKPFDALVIQEKLRKLQTESDGGMIGTAVSHPSLKNIFVKQSIQIGNISEFGFEVQSPEKIPVGQTLEFAGLPEEFFMLKSVFARSLSCQWVDAPQAYKVVFSFVGLPESQRQMIRKNCMKAWVQKKASA